MKGTEIRQKFLKYFEKNGHKVLPSASLIPSDPTVLLTLAGMLQFKRFFLGIEKSKFPRVTTVQKCIRMNDIENVGKTPRHHTFFEMLGNFSFGDYFKKEAISFAWEFLTVELKVDPSKLFIAIFKDDQETFDIWTKEMGLAADKITRLGEDNNFWSAGATGPCGPCSEIYYDFGPSYGCKKPDCAPGCDCDRFLEIWNLVFIQYNRDENGKLNPLPSKNIDTGMGLERIAAIMENVDSNYKTDLIKPIVERVAKFAQKQDNQMALNIIADHLRSSVHLLADGVIPGNEGRGYVLRRIIRRAVRYGRLIGIDQVFLDQCSGVVIDAGKSVYPELQEHSEFVKKVLRIEEENFRATLEQGLLILEELFEKHVQDKLITGAEAFRLHDTFGFPIDLTTEIAQENGFSVDRKAFDVEMDRQREKSRTAGMGDQEKINLIHRLDLSKVKPTVYVGYESMEVETKIIAIFPLEKVVVLEKTPFYPEGGGQVSDTGMLSFGSHDVLVTQANGAIGGVILHSVENIIDFKIGQKVLARVDQAKRKLTANHHTATHLLHASLRQILGETVKQAGSMVAPDRLRFDFTYPQALTTDEAEKVETIVNQKIKDGERVSTHFKSLEEAKKMGAMALFEQKYGEKVRLVRIGEFSLELCGGTHIDSTREIGFFYILSEAAISSGIRRIEAVCGEGAKATVVMEGKKLRDQIKLVIQKLRRLQMEEEDLGYQHALEPDVYEVEGTELDNLGRAADRLDSATVRRFLAHLKDRLEALQARAQKSQKRINELWAKRVLDGLGEIEKETEDFNGIKLLLKRIPRLNREILRQIADRAKNDLKSVAVFLVSDVSDEETIFLSAVTDDLVAKGIKAGDLVREASLVAGGKGGGKPTMAEGGGKDASKIGDVFAVVKDTINRALTRN